MTREELWAEIDALLECQQYQWWDFMTRPKFFSPEVVKVARSVAFKISVLRRELKAALLKEGAP